MSWWKKLVNKARGVYGSDAPEFPSGGGCDHGAINLRQGTAEFEWFVARAELEAARDLKHGAGHLANLLTYEPGNPEWVDLLEQYLAAAGPDPESLIPRGDKLYYGTEALRAYLWHKQGRLADAINLLVDVTLAKPEARYLEAWGLNWLEPAGAVASLPEPVGLRLFSVVLGRFPEARLLPLPRLRQMQRWARFSERFALKHPGEGAPVMLRAGFLRKAGLFDEAEAVVRPDSGRLPDWHSATALGLILREKGDWQGAEQAFQQALQSNPTDLSARLEAGDTLFERGEWQRALGWYESVQAKEPKHAWALPSALFCRWKLTQDERFLRELVELMKKGTQRAGQLCHREFANKLSEPADATANVLRKIREMIREDPEKSRGGNLSVKVSGLEAPSNLLAFRLEMEALRHDLRLSVAVERVAKPDPREAIGEVKYVLWKYQGTEAAPALPPPAPEVAGLIAELAAAPFDDQANWAAASRVAERIGPGRVAEVLAVMVHPPPVPEGKTALSWLPRVQRAAAEVAAQVDDGWGGSARREALLSVLLGPEDWSTEAAVSALGRLGRDSEAIAPDIHDAFQQLANHRRDFGYCCWERTLYQTWLTLPHLFPKEREELERTLRKIEARAQQEEG